MADISKIKLNGITYDIKDTTARSNSSGITETVGNTKYLRLDGTNKPTANIDFNSQNISSVKTLDAESTLSQFYTFVANDYIGTSTFLNDATPYLDLSLYTRDTEGNFTIKDQNDTTNNYKFGIYGGSYAFDDDDNEVELGEGSYLNNNVLSAMPRSLNMNGKVIAQASSIWLGSADLVSGAEYIISSKSAHGIQFNKINVDTFIESGGGNYNNVLDCLTTDEVRLMNVATPLDNTDAVNKQYADSVVSEIKSSYLPLSGGTLSGVLSAGGNKIISVATPTGNADAANKSYVDSKIPTALKNPNSISFTGASVATYDGSSAVIVNIPIIPTSLKNPNKLSFTGAVNTTYDGSAAVSVAITQVKLKSWTAEDFT